MRYFVFIREVYMKRVVAYECKACHHIFKTAAEAKRNEEWCLRERAWEKTPEARKSREIFEQQLAMIPQGCGWGNSSG